MELSQPSPSKRAEVERIDLNHVTSSLILSLGYAPDRQTVAVQFKNGAIYHYAGVPAETWELLGEAGSLGSAYNGLIKGQFSAECMTGECPQCGNKPGIIGERCDDCGCDVYEPECGAPHPEPSLNVYCSRPRRHGAETHEGKRGRQVYAWAEEV